MEGINVIPPVFDAVGVHVVDAFIVVVRPPSGMTQTPETGHLQFWCWLETKLIFNCIEFKCKI